MMTGREMALKAGFTETWLKNENNVHKLMAFAELVKQQVTPAVTPEVTPQVNAIIRERYGDVSSTGR